MKNFEFIINKYYQEIISFNNSINIKDKINECKKNLNIDLEDNFSDCYNDLIRKYKNKGAVYTPRNIVKYMIKNTITEEMLINNPFIKILDPCCGGGNFIIELYRYLFEIYHVNLYHINKKHNLNLNKENICNHVFKNNLYGYDIDDCALKILKLDLWSIVNKVDFEDNIKNKDFLLIDEKPMFDIILGNPPYIGHKSVDKNYIKNIKIFYDDVYKNKSDLCYCFIKKSKKVCKNKGKVSFIISRYFLESQNAIGIRNFIKSNYGILKIVDYYGIRPFKGNGIDPAIIFLNNISILNENYSFKMIRPFINQIRNKKFDIINEISTKGNVNTIRCSYNDLKEDKWIILNDIEKSIIDKIEKKSNCILNDVVKSFQGIITGCDNAFVVNDEILKEINIEEELLHPWIKSSNINKNKIKNSEFKLIYSNDVNEDIHKNALNYIRPFKEKLSNRRECLKKIRKWYELQWGRNKEIFQNKKIIFPYKCSENRFAIDKDGSYFSADIYGLEIIKDTISYEVLVQILNSELYDFYMKTILKKLGDYLYEYYPNNLLNLYISTDFCKKLAINFQQKELYEFYNISEEEILYIQNKLKP